MKININKKKLALTLGLILTFGGAYVYIYNKLHTNTPDDINDHTGKYIFNPDYKAFHKYDLVDLKSVYPTKLAYDPKWFILPPDKYITKEQPIPKQIKNIDDPIIRRQAYFKFLCKTEYSAYSIKYIDAGSLLGYDAHEEGILDLDMYRFMPKTKDTNLENSSSYNTDSNPFSLPIHNKDYIPPRETISFNFFFSQIDKPEYHPSYKSKFKEVMSYDGSIYKIEYVPINKNFLPLKKEKQFTSRYYKLSRYIEREEMRNLGISGHETIIYDTKDKQLVFYIKQFNIGSLLPWHTPGTLSNFSWIKNDGCNYNPTYIEKF